MWRTTKVSVDCVLIVTVIRTKTAISSGRSQQISTIIKDGALSTTTSEAIRMTTAATREIIVNVVLPLTVIVKGTRHSLRTVL